jgi:hypothetical protein
MNAKFDVGISHENAYMFYVEHMCVCVCVCLCLCMLEMRNTTTEELQSIWQIGHGKKLHL